MYKYNLVHRLWPTNTDKNTQKKDWKQRDQITNDRFSLGLWWFCLSASHVLSHLLGSKSIFTWRNSLVQQWSTLVWRSRSESAAGPGAGHTWDEGGADENIHLLALLGEQLHFSLDELLGHLLRVPALALARLLQVHLQGLGSERLELLQGRGPGERWGKAAVILGP